MTETTVTLRRNEDDYVTVEVTAKVTLLPDDVEIDRLAYRISEDEHGPLDPFPGVFPPTLRELEQMERKLENRATEDLRDSLEDAAAEGPYEWEAA